MSQDDASIRDLVARYADAVNRRDREAWAATWNEDSEWNLRGQPIKGRDAIVGLWSNLMGSLPFVVQLIHSGTVEVKGDTATGRWYLTEYMTTAEGQGRMGVGVYRDVYSRTGGTWRFAVRRYDLLYNGPTDLSGETSPFPA